MDSKTILGLSFTSVFLLSMISVVTAIQADSSFKIKHLPDFKTTKPVNIETVKINLKSEHSDFTNPDDVRMVSGYTFIEKKLKN